MNVFDAALSVPIAQVINAYSGIETAVYGNISCPFHEDKKPSMHIYPDTNTYYCFACRKSGNGITFLMDYLHLASRLDAAKELCKRFNVPYDTGNYVAKVDKAYAQYTSVISFCSKLFTNEYKRASYDYFKTRGLDSLIDAYGLGYCPTKFVNAAGNAVSLKTLLLSQFNISEDLLDSYGLYNTKGDCVFSDRYIFTLYNSNGDPIGFSGRSLNREPKYYNTKTLPFFEKSSFLYNYSKAKRYGTIYVVEGQADCLSLIASGIDNVVSSLGTAFGAKHLELLKSKDIVLAFDNDKAGKDNTVRIIEANPNISFKVFEGVKDFKDFNEALCIGYALKPVLQKRIRYSAEFMLDYLRDSLDLSYLSNREEIYNRVSAVAKPYGPVAKDFFSVKLQRLLKGRRGGV